MKNFILDLFHIPRKAKSRLREGRMAEVKFKQPRRKNGQFGAYQKAAIVLEQRMVPIYEGSKQVGSFSL